MRSLVQGLLLTVFASASAIASPAEILDANRSATAGTAWDGKSALTSEYAYAGQGLTGSIHSRADLQKGWWVDAFEIGPATGANGFNGAHAWAKDQSGTVTIQDGGEQRELAVNDGYRRANMWWRADRGGAAVADDGTKSDGGNNYDVLTVMPSGGKKFDAWFDAKTHLLFRTIEQQGPQTITTTFSGYAPVDGVQFAGKTMITDGDTKYDQAMTLKSAKFESELPPGIFSAPDVKVTDHSIAGGAHQTSFPFELINNHIYAAATVNGKGPYTFIFDTGGVNVVTPRVAKELGLKSEGKMEGQGAGSGHMDFALTKLSKLQLGAAEVKDQLFVVAPLDAMAPIEGVDMPGMVGFETFRRFVTRFDYGTHTITLFSPDGFDPKDAGIAVPFKFNGNMIEINATYGGSTGNYTIDTGSRSSLTFTTPYAAAHDLYRGATAVDAVTGWGVGGPTRSRVLHGQPLSLGSETVQSPVVEVSTDKSGATVDPAVAGNIGAGILKRYIVTLDYGHQVMYLKPVTTPVDDLDTFDRAGLWINQSAEGFAVVDVMKGAPADQAGLKVGDIIVG
ncbi:MAG TPA: aspartyl protease family protein, partial [Rhizomicrobium sp.]